MALEARHGRGGGGGQALLGLWASRLCLPSVSLKVGSLELEVRDGWVVGQIRPPRPTVAPAGDTYESIFPHFREYEVSIRKVPGDYEVRGSQGVGPAPPAPRPLVPAEGGPGAEQGAEGTQPKWRPCRWQRAHCPPGGHRPGHFVTIVSHPLGGADSSHWTEREWGSGAVALTPITGSSGTCRIHPFPDTTAELTASGKALSPYETHPFLFNTK